MLELKQKICRTENGSQMITLKSWKLIIEKENSQMSIYCLRDSINNKIIISLSKMQNALIMNKLALPRYFDGENWNTVFKPNRKSIPKYLHEDLPQLKLLQLKERFKQIGKFNCPRLEYFDDYIRKHNTVKQKKPKSSRYASQKKEYERVQQELQYALMLCDWKSPVLDDLISRSKSIKKPNESKSKQKGRYFPNTIDLVFRNRKNMYLSQHRKKQDDFTSSSVEQKVQQIKLLPFN